MLIELTHAQLDALHDSADAPPRGVDPVTRTTYVLLPAHEYEELQSLLTQERAQETAWLSAATQARRAWAAENPY